MVLEMKASMGLPMLERMTKLYVPKTFDVAPCSFRKYVSGVQAANGLQMSVPDLIAKTAASDTLLGFLFDSGAFFMHPDSFRKEMQSRVRAALEPLINEDANQDADNS